MNTKIPVQKHRDFLFRGIGVFSVCSAQQIINADFIKVCQLYNHFHRIMKNTQLILRIRILFDMQIVRNLLLCISAVDSHIADRFIFHHIVAHLYHPMRGYNI